MRTKIKYSFLFISLFAFIIGILIINHYRYRNRYRNQVKFNKYTVFERKNKAFKLTRIKKPQEIINDKFKIKCYNDHYKIYKNSKITYETDKLNNFKISSNGFIYDINKIRKEKAEIYELNIYNYLGETIAKINLGQIIGIEQFLLTPSGVFIYLRDKEGNKVLKYYTKKGELIFKKKNNEITYLYTLKGKYLVVLKNKLMKFNTRIEFYNANGKMLKGYGNIYQIEENQGNILIEQKYGNKTITSIFKDTINANKIIYRNNKEYQNIIWKFFLYDDYLISKNSTSRKEIISGCSLNIINLNTYKEYIIPFNYYYNFYNFKEKSHNLYIKAVENNPPTEQKKKSMFIRFINTVFLEKINLVLSVETIHHYKIVIMEE